MLTVSIVAEPKELLVAIHRAHLRVPCELDLEVRLSSRPGIVEHCVVEERLAERWDCQRRIVSGGVEWNGIERGKQRQRHLEAEAAQ